MRQKDQFQHNVMCWYPACGVAHPAFQLDLQKEKMFSDIITSAANKEGHFHSGVKQELHLDKTFRNQSLREKLYFGQGVLGT